MTFPASGEAAVPAWRRVRSVSGFDLGAVLSVVLAALALAPLAYLVWRTLEGGESALAALVRPRTRELVIRSVLLAGAVASTSAVIGLALAWLTERVDLSGRRLLAVLFALPLAVPSYLTAYALVAVFGPRGVLAGALERAFGFERLPEFYGFFGAWFTLTLVTYPYAYLSVRAALRGVDPTLEDAARLLGHGRFCTFLRVTLPLLRPGIVSGMLLSALYTLADFGAIAILRYPTLTYSIYNQYRLSFDRSAAAALALLLVAISAMLVVAERRWRRRAAFYRLVGVARSQPRGRPRWWAWGVLAIGLALVGTALGAPAGIAAYWLWRARMLGEALPSVSEPLVHSLVVGIGAATLTVSAGFLVARTIVRTGGRMASALDLPLWISYALPGIVLALALVSLTAQFLPFLYQTLALLFVGYLLRFLPEAVGTLRSVLLQQNPRLEEAARTLGMRPWRAWLRVQLPLALPGFGSAFALVFLTTVKELPVTLLLSPIGFPTLATTIWNATAEAYWSHAALPTLLLLSIGVVPMGFFNWWQERTLGEGRG
ncbi:MAG: iron ABC transporter permease [Thermomicrobium sp.]|nr:iron ABC transporter permease [Thermomicrobium sp.]MDW8060953.1 iron ABC transporter permease [Thermomicrobium sp.]